MSRKHSTMFGTMDSGIKFISLIRPTKLCRWLSDFNTLKDSLTNIDTNITTQDELEELAVTLCDKLMKAVDTSTPKVYSRNDPKSSISQAILDLIKEKRRLRRLYNSRQDPNIKSTINKLQKEAILQIYKQCVRPIFEYGIVSTITVSETVITKIQRVQKPFIRLALRFPKYVSAHLLHEASGLPYVKERLISVGQNHLARRHANPLVEHTINSAKTSIAWDKYKTPISILKPPD